MADVTVNIQGDSSRLNRSDDNTRATTPPREPDRRTSSEADSERMIEDVRREMQQRGVLMVPGSSSVTQIVDEYAYDQKQAANERITSKYDRQRAALSGRIASSYEDVDEQVEKEREDNLKRLREGGVENDPLHRSVLEAQMEERRESLMRKVGTRHDEDERKIDEAEKDERKQVESELTDAIKELTEYYNRQTGRGGAPADSFIGQLQQQQKALIYERDTASTEEEAREASKRLADVNRDLNRAMGKEEVRQRDPYSLTGLQMGQGAIGALAALQQGDWAGTLMGGAIMSGNPYAIAGAAIVAGAGTMIQSTSDTSESVGDFASLRSGTGGMSGKTGREMAWKALYDGRYGDDRFTSLGMGLEDFSDAAFRRSKARGSTDNWYEETYGQIALEKSFGMSEGSLEIGSKFDRYGQTVTDAVAQMVTTLNSITESGVNYGDFTRVQEKYDIQQSIMSSYLGRTDKPDYDVANQMLAAFSSVGNITQDARMGTDIQQFQGMVQNPMNDRMKALIFSTVQDLFPETDGRVDLIDRALKDPENEGKIIQAVVQRIELMYGGTDTTMGYLAFKKALPHISPDRRDEYIDAFSSGTTAGILTGGSEQISDSKSIMEQNKDIWIRQGAELAATKTSENIKNIELHTKTIVGKMDGFVWSSPVPNSTRDGK